MSGLLNIGSENSNDAFYRYKMPKLVAKVEGRGNGIKTNIVNNVDVAKALDRPPNYIVKFFGTELGAQTKFDEKTGVSIVNGSHTFQTLSELLEQFIKKYVQCYSCGNPETVIKVKRDDIQMKCKACGALSVIDITARFAAYILKNPPPKKDEKKKIKTKQDEITEIQKEEEKKVKAAAKNKTKKENKAKAANGSDDNDNEVIKSEKTCSKDMDISKQSDNNVMSISNGVHKNESNGREAQPIQEVDQPLKQTDSQQAQLDGNKQDQQEKKESQEGDQEAVEEVQEEEIDDPIVNIRDMVDNKNPPLLVADYLRNISSLTNLVAQMKVLYHALFGTENTKISDEVNEKVKYLKSFSGDQQSQVAQLIGFEFLVSVVKPVNDLGEITLILMALFENDIVDEGIIKLWYKRVDFASKFGVEQEQAKQLRKCSEKFVEWLETADEEESDKE